MHFFVEGIFFFNFFCVCGLHVPSRKIRENLGIKNRNFEH